MFTRFFALFFAVSALAHGQKGEWHVVSSEQRSQGHGVTHVEKRLRNGSHPRKTTVHLMLLDRAKTRLKVVEVNPEESVAQALDRAGALAGMNGGYFHKDRSPLGLVVMKGKEKHPLQRSKLLSGVVEITPKRARLLRRGEFQKSRHLQEALQAGPFLVDKSAEVQGLNASKAAERTVVLSDKDGIVALAMISPLTLAETGRLLATPGLFAELPPITRALNLDGGSSTAFRIGPKPPLTPYSHSEWKRVINALGVFPR